MPSRPTARTPRMAARPSVGLALIAGLIFLVLFAATFAFFVATDAGQRLDAAAMLGAQAWGRARTPATGVVSVISTFFIAGAVIVIVAIALVRRRPALALAAVIFIAGANVSTQALKKFILDRPDLGVSWQTANSFPSGHTTVAATVGLGLLLVVAPRMRVAAAILAAGFAAATGLAVVILGWHRPADVLGALEVCGVWITLVLAGWGVMGKRPGEGTLAATRTGWSMTVIGAGALALAAGLAFTASLKMPSDGQITQVGHVEPLVLAASWIAAVGGVGGICLAVSGTALALLSGRRA